MLKNFLHIYKAIKSVIQASDSKAFKDKSLILTETELLDINNILNIISIFVKTVTKLQAEAYPTIYYIVLEVYKIFTKLEKFLGEFKVSFSFLLYTTLLILYRIKTISMLLMSE